MVFIAMSKFVEVKASWRSLTRRRPVFGKGTNDAWYSVNQMIDGKKVTCPYFRVWSGMLRRCLSEYHKKRNPAYRDAKVCDEWLIFSNFKSWMEKQDWRGKELDKDILVPGNKLYAPQLCIFVPKHINVLFVDKFDVASNHPAGFIWSKRERRFHARCQDSSGKKRHLGSFRTAEDAHSAYLTFKSQVFLCHAEVEPQACVKAALMRRAALIMDAVA